MRYIPLLVSGQLTFIALAIAARTADMARTLAFIAAVVMGAIAVRSARNVLGERFAVALGLAVPLLGLLWLLDQGMLPTIRIRF